MLIKILKIVGWLSIVCGGICAVEVLFPVKEDFLSALERAGVGIQLFAAAILFGSIFLSCAQILENQYDTYRKISNEGKLEKWCCEDCGSINRKMKLRCNKCGRVR